MSNRLKLWQQVLAIICVTAVYSLFNYVPAITQQAPPIGWKSCSPDSTAPYCDFSLVYTLQGHPKAKAIALSADSKILLTGGEDKAIKIWDLSTGKLQKTLQSDSGVINSLAIAPDGKTVVSGNGDRIVRIWDLTSDRPPQMLKGHSGGVSWVQISTDGTTLVSLDTGDFRDPKGGSPAIKVWDLGTGEQKATLSNYSNFASISPDGKTVFFDSSSSGKLVAWDVVTNKQRVLPFSPGGLERISLDGETLVSVKRLSKRGFRVQISDLKGGTVRVRRRFSRKALKTSKIALSDRLLIGSTPKGISLWNLQTAELEATLNVNNLNRNNLKALAVSPNGKLLVGIADNSNSGIREIKVLRRP